MAVKKITSINQLKMLYKNALKYLKLDLWLLCWGKIYIFLQFFFFFIEILITSRLTGILIGILTVITVGIPWNYISTICNLWPPPGRQQDKAVIQTNTQGQRQGYNINSLKYISYQYLITIMILAVDSSLSKWLKLKLSISLQEREEQRTDTKN